MWSYYGALYGAVQYRPTEDQLDYFASISMQGKTVVVTAADVGAGVGITTELARRGARIIMGCIDMKSGEAAKKQILETVTNAILIVKPLDLASLDSVKYFGEEILVQEKKVHILINHGCTNRLHNAVTDDDFPVLVQVNYVALYMLSYILTSKLIAAGSSRIINISSPMYWFDKKTLRDMDWCDEYFNEVLQGYDISKLAVVMLTKKLVQQLEGKSITVNTMHPGPLLGDTGLEKDDMVRHILGMSTKNYRDSVFTAVFLASSPDVSEVTGRYFEECQELPMFPFSETEMFEQVYNYTFDLAIKKMYEEEEENKPHNWGDGKEDSNGMALV